MGPCFILFSFYKKMIIGILLDIRGIFSKIGLIFSHFRRIFTKLKDTNWELKSVLANELLCYWIWDIKEDPPRGYGYLARIQEESEVLPMTKQKH